MSAACPSLLEIEAVRILGVAVETAAGMRACLGRKLELHIAERISGQALAAAA